MKTKTFIVETCVGADNKRTYIIRELSPIPAAPSKIVAVCESTDELAQFFDNVQI